MLQLSVLWYSLLHLPLSSMAGTGERLRYDRCGRCTPCAITQDMTERTFFDAGLTRCLPAMPVELIIFGGAGNKVNVDHCPCGLVCAGGLAYSILSIYGDCRELRKEYITLCNIPKKPLRGVFSTLAETQGICAKGCTQVVNVKNWYGGTRVRSVGILRHELVLVAHQEVNWYALHPLPWVRFIFLRRLLAREEWSG